MSADAETATTTDADGRCRAISRSANRRCHNPDGHGPRGELCATHARETDPVTIDSDPRTLVKTVSPKYPARCRAIQYDGERCETGCGPTDRFCALHKTISLPEVTDLLAPGELDTALVKSALSSVEETNDARLMTDGGEPTDESDDPEVTADWLEGRYFCYPIECGVCGDQLAGPEENGVIGRGDALAIDADGRAICQAHTDEISFVAAGVYAHGGGTPCETNRSFKPEDVVAVERPDDARLATDGGVTDSPEPAPISVELEVTDREVTWNASAPTYERLENHPSGNLATEIEEEVATREGSVFEVIVAPSGAFWVVGGEE
jgi:hypothetical protein